MTGGCMAWLPRHLAGTALRHVLYYDPEFLYEAEHGW